MDRMRSITKLIHKGFVDVCLVILAFPTDLVWMFRHSGRNFLPFVADAEMNGAGLLVVAFLRSLWNKVSQHKTDYQNTSLRPIYTSNFRARIHIKLVHFREHFFCKLAGLMRNRTYVYSRYFIPLHSKLMGSPTSHNFMTKEGNLRGLYSHNTSFSS
jgi:hypothetical protein